MSVASPSATPSRVYAAFPVQWMRAFAYTPDSDRSGHRHSAIIEDDMPLSDKDALPTRFHSRGGVPNSGRDPVRGGDGPEGYVSDPCLTVPAKRKRKRGSREGPSLSLADITDGLSGSATRGSSSRKTRSRMPTNGGSRHKRGLGPSHAPAPSTPSRPRPRRVVLDAVEIVRKERSGDRIADPRTVRAGCPTESARKTASSHYPSPPASCARRDTAEREERISPDLMLPLKTSKYFTRASAPPTRFVLENLPARTSPSSPMLTIPPYIESSDFEYPPPDVSFDEPVEDAVNESRHIPTWYNSPGPFDDLMIMLRRLKPILVQGA